MDASIHHADDVPYLMISTTCYFKLDTKMAMKIGGKYDFDGLFPRHIAQMAKEVLLSSALVHKSPKPN